MSIAKFNIAKFNLAYPCNDWDRLRREFPHWRRNEDSISSSYLGSFVGSVVAVKYRRYDEENREALFLETKDKLYRLLLIKMRGNTYVSSCVLHTGNTLREVYDYAMLWLAF